MKLSVLKEATPLFVVEAFSPAIVIAEPEAEVSIPSPAVKVNVPPSPTVPVPVSPASETFGSARLAFVILPANIAFVIPPALTCKASDTTAIEALSTLTSKVFPAFTRAAPATTCPAPENCDTGNSVLLDKVLSVNVGIPL